jgi:nickel/cobalt exporter
LTLTVAIHPYQAFELVRGGTVERFDLEKLRSSGDLVSAYVQNHVSVAHDGGACSWDADSAHTPPTEIEAVGDGVTISGPLHCPSFELRAPSSLLSLTSDIFLDGFPSQTNIVRLDLPDGYADRATMDARSRSVDVDVSPLSATTSATDTLSHPARRPDAPYAELAKRILDPGIGIIGLVSLLASAFVIGMLHALGPGHGKSLMAATLVGQRATFRRVFALGTVMTVTHVSDVFILAILASSISAVLPPTALLQTIQLISAFGLIVFGILNLWRAIIRYRQVASDQMSGALDDAHRRAHELGLPHAHEHAHEHGGHGHGTRISNLESRNDPNFKRVLWLGFIGSLAPCPTAWAVFMATLAVGRPGAGFAILVAFSLGLYTTILLIGSLFVTSTAFALRHTPARLTYVLPVISALCIVLLGIMLSVRLVG